jgi:dipeptidyl aminopeptidase/acylaminoacyl peptidase
MSMPNILPYGTWPSPVTLDLITRQTISVRTLLADGDALYWLEGRPDEAGRFALMRWTPDGGKDEVVAAPISIGTRVYEYGGAPYHVRDGWIVYSDNRDNSVWLIPPGEVPRRIADVPGCRYADFRLDLPRRRVLAVREDHRARPVTNPEIAIVALTLDPAPGVAADGVVLVFGPSFLAAPRLSPDGTKLAWIEWYHPNMPWDRTRLRLAELDAFGAPFVSALIVSELPESILQPLFAPDGTLHFISDRTGWWNLYAWRDADAVPIAPVAAEIGGPEWFLGQRYYDFLADGRILCTVVEDGFRTAALIKNGRLAPLDLGLVRGCPVPLGDGFAYLATPPDAPEAIIRRDTLAGPDTEIIMAAGPASLDKRDIAIGRPIRFRSADGSYAHGFFYAPTNARFKAPADERPPLLVIAHGGPTLMCANTFSLLIQWWTTRGFAVVDVNYGGSTGFGRAYRQRLNGQWGVVDVEDCIAAARYLITGGRVDPARIAIRGSSAGGYTALAALAASDVFKAGASYCGITDPLLMALETHKFESHYLDRLIGPMPDAVPLYRRRSPLAQVDRITAPVIFFQGLDDKVVPPHQVEEMAEAMADRQLPVAYYAFAGEGHGFRKAETIRRMLDLELSFYGRIFGFTPPGLEERVILPNLP